MKNDEKNRPILIYFGGLVWFDRYDPSQLSDADQFRSEVPRARRAEQDWRVSRAIASELRLKAGVDRNAPIALSHSHGHALVGMVPAGWSLGVDIERCRPRDVQALAQWVCSEEEQRFLAEISDPVVQRQQFYVLWTLKESLVKAASLSFPDGMAKVGLTGVGTSDVSLRMVSAGWRASVWQLDSDWIAAVAWQQNEPEVSEAKVAWLSDNRALLLGNWCSSI